MLAAAVASLNACVQVGDLAGFMCTEAEVMHKYKYKLLRAAFSNLPSIKEASMLMPTKVGLQDLQQSPVLADACGSSARCLSGAYCCHSEEAAKCLLSHLLAESVGSACLLGSGSLLRAVWLQVTIDSQGVMKVMHMVSLTGGPASQAGYLGPSSMSQSQASSRRGWVQFMLLPQDAIIEYDADDDT